MPGEEGDAESWREAEAYEVLAGHDVDDDPTPFRPIGPGDVFADVELAHLAVPFRGYAMVVGHPCSLRRGIALQLDVPVAPVEPPGIPTRQHPVAERVLPVGTMIPPGASEHHVVHLTRTTTVPSDRLQIGARVATLSATGIVALQQRVIGNQSRVKVPPGVIAAHVRGPLAELELWTDWREEVTEAGHTADDYDPAFDAFMSSASGFGELSWRLALGEHEHARARAVAAMQVALNRELGG